MKSKAPIIPMIIGHSNKLHPIGRHYVTPGKLSIKFLKPISTHHYRRNNLQEEAEKIRDLYQHHLANMDVVTAEKVLGPKPRESIAS